MTRPPKPGDIWPAERRPWTALWRDHARVAADSLRFVARRLPSTLLVWLLIGIALALPAALYLIHANLSRLGDDWLGQAGFSVYFRVGAPAERPAALAAALSGRDGVANVRLITPAEALAEFEGRAQAAGALALLDHNPLPASLRVSMSAEAPAAQLAALAAVARREEGVDDVVVERTWLERLAAVRAVVARLALLFALLLGMGAVLVSTSSVRVALEVRLTELKVLTLVGASKRFIRRPFLYLGALYGCGGALLAAMLMSGALVWLEAPLQRLLGAYGQDFAIAGFHGAFLAGLLALGAALGAIGAVIAARARLKDLTVE